MARRLDPILALLALGLGLVWLVPLAVVCRTRRWLTPGRCGRRILYLGTGQIAQVFPRNGVNLFLERECSDFDGYFEQLWNVHFPAGSRGALDLTPRHHLIDVDLELPGLVEDAAPDRDGAARGGLPRLAAALRHTAAHLGGDGDESVPAGAERGAGWGVARSSVRRDHHARLRLGLGGATPAGVPVGVSVAGDREARRTLGVVARGAGAGGPPLLPRLRGAQRGGADAGGVDPGAGRRRLCLGASRPGRARGATG